MCLVCFINAEESRSKQEELKLNGNGNENGEGTEVEEGEQGGGEDLDGEFCGDCAPLDIESDIDTDGGHAVHYFAIGSMTNSTSLSLRELSPIFSRPATLPGYRMLFRGTGGMATAEREGVEVLEGDAEYPFSCIHGVLHLLTAQHMKVLDDFEGGYKRTACLVQLYDGTEVRAFVYQMSLKKLPSKHELPSERYLDIIAQGCAAHGVDERWVAFVRGHACTPRKNPRDFSAFRMNSLQVPILSWERVRGCTGADGSPLWVVINNKVLEFKGDPTSFFPCGYFIKNCIGGTDFTVKFAKGFYEPRYRLGSEILCASELENEHRAWVEDQFANPPPVLASSRWALVGVVPTESVRSHGTRRTRCLASQPRLSLVEDVNTGYCQFFVSGSAAGTWWVPDGRRAGQTLYLRKTSERDFEGDVSIRIRHQTLCPSTERGARTGEVFTMGPGSYSLAFCWDGRRWFLEHEGR